MTSTLTYIPPSMRQRIYIQAPVRTQDKHTGEWKDNWQTISDIAANMDMSGILGESMSSDKVLSQVTAYFTIRYLSKLTPDHRILCKGYTYQIVSIVDLGTTHYQRLTTIRQA